MPGGTVKIFKDKFLITQFRFASKYDRRKRMRELELDLAGMVMLITPDEIETINHKINTAMSERNHNIYWAIVHKPSRTVYTETARKTKEACNMYRKGFMMHPDYECCLVHIYCELLTPVEIEAYNKGTLYETKSPFKQEKQVLETTESVAGR